MMWHPNKYAELLAKKMQEHGTRAWLVNTGWVGGPYGVGSRIKLSYTRAILDAIHQGAFDNVEMVTDEQFGFQIPVTCPAVPPEVLLPWKTWSSEQEYEEAKQVLIGLFQDNFEQFASGVNPAILQAGPVLKGEHKI